MGLRDPTVAPPGDGGLDGSRSWVGAQPLPCEREEGGCDLHLAGLEVLAAPLRSGVNGDAGSLRDALALIVPDPVQRLALDLHAAGLGNPGWPVEQRHECEARGVGDVFQLAACLTGHCEAAR